MPPFKEQAHHPLTHKQIDYSKSDQAVFQRELFDPLWQSVSDDLFERIDGLKTALKRPASLTKPKEA